MDNWSEESIRQHRTESISAVICSCILILFPIIVSFFDTTKAHMIVKDLGFVIGLSVIVLLLRGKDIFTANKALKKLKSR